MAPFLWSKTSSAPELLILSTKVCKCQLCSGCWRRMWTFHKRLQSSWPRRASRENEKGLISGGEPQTLLSGEVWADRISDHLVPAGHVYPHRPLYWLNLGLVFRAAFILHNHFNKVLKHSSHISFHIRSFHVRLTTPEFLKVFAAGAGVWVSSPWRSGRRDPPHFDWFGRTRAANNDQHLPINVHKYATPFYPAEGRERVLTGKQHRRCTSKGMAGSSRRRVSGLKSEHNKLSANNKSLPARQFSLGRVRAQLISTQTIDLKKLLLLIQ